MVVEVNAVLGDCGCVGVVFGVVGVFAIAAVAVVVGGGGSGGGSSLDSNCC